jgi:cytochrome c oxidase subunit 2
MSVIPPDAYEVQVTARMWTWSFMYPNGHIDGELHVPINTPVRLVLHSEDVIHSLFIPAFRIKKDAVPGRYNKFWFEANQAGTFDVFCAEYCGTQHSQMLTKVVVHEKADFQAWLERASNWETRMTPVDAGRMLYETRGCAQCHSLDGSPNIGPSLKDVFGSTVQLSDGSQVVADENYLRDSILYPQKQIVAGYNPVMSSYAGILKDRDVTAVIWFLKANSRHYQGPTPQRLTTGPATTQAATTRAATTKADR